MINQLVLRQAKIIGLTLAGLVMSVFAGTSAAQTSVRFTVWDVPDASHYPHDPMAHSDGSIWYAARMSSTLGRFDTETETWDEYFTPIPQSGPHGLKEDAEGNIYFTAIDADPTYIGKLNVTTGEITDYPITFDDKVACPECREAIGMNPGRQPKSAHSLSIDQDGTVWFSMFGDADMLGRLVPSTGEVTVAISPKRGVGPYGVQIDSQGTPWYSLVRGGGLARVNPDTMAIKTYDPPWPDARPRRIWMDEDDTIWYTDFARGSIGHFDPKVEGSEAWTEWPSPGGEWSRPYGMTLMGGAVWYSETFMDPSTLVRFDMETEQFESWDVPECYGGGYMLVPDADENLWFTCHDTDKMVRVEVN